MVLKLRAGRDGRGFQPVERPQLPGERGAEDEAAHNVARVEGREIGGREQKAEGAAAAQRAAAGDVKGARNTVQAHDALELAARRRVGVQPRAQRDAPLGVNRVPRDGDARVLQRLPLRVLGAQRHGVAARARQVDLERQLEPALARRGVHHQVLLQPRRAPGAELARQQHRRRQRARQGEHAAGAAAGRHVRGGASKGVPAAQVHRNGAVNRPK